jgi:hypothetical protein
MGHSTSIAILIVVLAWAAYRRIKRTVGYQPLSVRRLRTRIIILAVIGALPLVAGVLHPFLYAAFAMGAAAGAALSLVAAHYLVFERREGKLFYRTHVWVEIVVLVLFFGRIVYRLAEVLRHPPGSASAGAQPFGTLNDPLSAGALAFFLAYYIAFAWNLLVRSRRLQAPPEDKD